MKITNEDNMQLMARYPDKYFDLAIVDPPYGINADREHKEGNGWVRREQKGWDYEIPKNEYWKELKRVSKNQIVWGGNYFTDNLHQSMGWILWDKGQRNFSLADGELAWTSFNKALRIFEYSRGKHTAEKAGFHATEKPVVLYKWLLDKYAKEGDKILDTHLGSGSIAIACHDFKFDLTACELDKEYFDKAMQRIENHKAQLKLF
jgi:site-specific DNA-methyltransferase (adenine-specific)